MKNIIAIKTVGQTFISNRLFAVGDVLADTLISQGRARLATAEEVEAGRGLVEEAPKPAPKKRGRKPKAKPVTDHE